MDAEPALNLSEEPLPNRCAALKQWNQIAQNLSSAKQDGLEPTLSEHQSAARTDIKAWHCGSPDAESEDPGTVSNAEWFPDFRTITPPMISLLRAALVKKTYPQLDSSNQGKDICLPK
jgi:hypothetical protein